ncbi:hypothetical protein ACFPAF_20105 [Hymenobacter endophyticus]|uniref:Uncharacterized protein n=1 Tax=Hymenobacter endophyticus TaxID=3076335 RepID=A0ABU3TMX5_9BACT|nr:hypothetical protein [Hymenobacter endophyticus]MDU0372715.1 hypothetical protein [Hymenobacter endophyticus]
METPVSAPNLATTALALLLLTDLLPAAASGTPQAASATDVYRHRRRRS